MPATKIPLYDLEATVKAIIQDLIDASEDDGKGLTRERLQSLEAAIDSISIDPDELEAGNFTESFQYDLEGNVKVHTSVGDRAFTVTYNYKGDGSGELTTSVKEFKDKDGNNVVITKTYTYTSGDITGIATTTVVAPAT